MLRRKLLPHDSKAGGDYSLLFRQWQDESRCGNSHIMRLALRLCPGIGQFPGLSYAKTANTPEDPRDMQICHPVNQTENTYKGVK